MRAALGVMCFIMVAAQAQASEKAASPPSADAKEERAVAKPGAGRCPYQEQVTLNVTINGREKTIREAKALFDKRTQEIEEFARQAGSGKININNMNYNINAQPQYGTNGAIVGVVDYQLSGNVGYQLDNAETAVALMEKLEKQNVQSSLNVNAYRNQPCSLSTTSYRE